MKQADLDAMMKRQTLMYPERLQEIKRRTGSAAYESYQLADEALTLRSERDTLAARVIELEAENKRLRERLNTIRALAAKSQNEGGPNFDLEIIEGFAIAALEGGTS